MRVLSNIVGTCLLLIAISAHALQGEFDRTEEVQQYLATLVGGTRIVLTRTALQIHEADLSDARLARALVDKLRSDLPKLSDTSHVDEKYLEAMIAAAASTGIGSVAPDLQTICASLSVRKQEVCRKEIALVDWYRDKNRVAASMLNHVAGADPAVSRLINLVKSDDISHKSWAARQLHTARITDVRLTDAIAEQVLKLDSAASVDSNRDKAAVIGFFIVELGNSGNSKYESVMDHVLASTTNKNLQLKARTAQKRLRALAVEKT